MGTQTGHESAMITHQVYMGEEVFPQRTPVGLEDCLLAAGLCLFQTGCAGRQNCQCVSLGWSIGGIIGKVAASLTHPVRSGCDYAGVCLASSIRTENCGACCHDIASLGKLCRSSTGPLVKRTNQTMGSILGLEPGDDGCP